MKKNVLIIDSSESNQPLLFDLLSETGFEKYHFSLRYSGKVCPALRDLIFQNRSTAKKIYLGPRLDNGPLAYFLFNLIYPILWTIFFFFLAFHKFFRKTEVVVCLSWNEKFLTALPARLLGLKIVWLERPDENYSLGRFTKFFFVRASRRAKIIVFSAFSASKLEKIGVRQEQVARLVPGIKLNNHTFQDNIFNNLARLEKKQKKFFSLGIATRLDSLRDFEPLFQVVKNCLSVIPNLQLIIVGDGKEKKNLSWLAKKMDIETLVWFVGEQAHLKKWLESFDVFIELSDNPGADDLLTTLKALAAELPVIARSDCGLEELIEDQKTGILIDFTDGEKVAQAIIKLFQERRVANRLGQAGRIKVEADFNLAKTKEQFEQHL